MSKKRKTRKQKEAAKLRHTTTLPATETSVPVYSVNIKKSPVRKVETESKSSAQDAVPFMKKDITSISAASGIILAFDILLFTLLSSGFIKLNFLGY